MLCVDSLCRASRTLHFINVPAGRWDAPLLIFLHGFPDNAFGWIPQIEALKGQFHIAAPFLPNTLNAQDSNPEEFKELKQDLACLVSHLRHSSTQKVFIVSHDLGSFLSASFCSKYEKQLNGLIHLNGLGLDQYVSRKWSLSQWRKSQYVLWLQSSFFRSLVRKQFPQFFLNLVYNRSDISHSDALRINPVNVLGGIHVYKYLFGRAYAKLNEKTQKTTLPVLFIWGKDDAFLNVPTLTEVERFHRNGAVRILPGGHWIMRSQPKHVNSLIFKTLLKWSEAS